MAAVAVCTCSASASACRHNRVRSRPGQPDAIVACASTPTRGGFYIGEWESLVADDLPRLVADQFNASLSPLMLPGASVGGYGALKLVSRASGPDGQSGR